MISLSSLVLAESGALRDTDGPTPPHKLEIGPGGNGTIRGDLTEISSTTLKISSWGGVWMVNVTPNTKILRRFDGKASVDEMAVGDRIGVSGTFSRTSTAINAAYVKDWSIQRRFATFRGIVTSVGVGEFTMTARQKVDGENRDLFGTTTIRVLIVPETKLIIKGATSTGTTTSIQTGMRADVRGIWNRLQSVLTADKIVARFPEEKKDTSVPPPTATSTTTSTPPTANAGPFHIITISQPHRHQGATASDSDGNLKSYNWSLVSCPATCPSLDESTGDISGGSANVQGAKFTPNQLGNYTLRLTVFDKTNLQASSTVIETVVSQSTATSTTTSTPPTANAGGGHQIPLNKKHTHTGATATDPNGDLASYRWKFASGGCPSLCPSLDGAEGSLPQGSTTVSVPGPSFNPLNLGNYKLELIVKDRVGVEKATSTVVDIAVNNQPVIITMGQSHTLVKGNAHTHVGAQVSDLDQNLTTYKWKLITCPEDCPLLANGEGNLSNSSSTVSVSGPTFTPNKNGTYELRLKIEDAGGLSASSTISEVATTSVSATDQSRSLANVLEALQLQVSNLLRRIADLEL